MLKKILFSLTCSLFLLSPTAAFARDAGQITDWYIKDFQSEIVVNKDSSLDITEKIVADCGNLPNKHGIFRVLPLFYQKTSSVRVKTPVELASITDFNGTPYQYKESRNRDTVTWKIGDANKTVTGENNYKIVYHIKNTIRFYDSYHGIKNTPDTLGKIKWDEFYWNLSGNFWQIGIDQFVAKIVFPDSINQLYTSVNLYTGQFGDKGQDAASSWQDNILTVASTKQLAPGQGVTASVTFPQGIFTEPAPTFWEKYGAYFWLFLPLIVFLLCFRLWQKYGRDPKLGKTVIPEYEPPENISPLQMDMIMNNRNLKNSSLSAAIINLAVHKAIKIEEIPKKWLLGSKDYKLTLIDKNFENSKLTDAEKYLVNCLFADHDPGISINYLSYKTSKEVKAAKDKALISGLRNHFYPYIPLISEKVKREEPVASSFSTKSFTWKWIFLGCGIAGIFLTVWIIITIGNKSGIDNLAYPAVGGFASTAILFFFAALMPKRTPAGAELLWQIKGFKLYMETAEKYREQFNEKENIFEKFLPYAMVFGIVGLWVQKMKIIYGEEYFNTYHPYWYGGYVGSFNVDTFTNSMNAVATSMAATMASSPSSSGSGGGGSSGGGGGGGGGGGW